MEQDKIEETEANNSALILALTQEVEHLREIIQTAKNCLVASAIGDPMEICENTLIIMSVLKDLKIR